MATQERHAQKIGYLPDTAAPSSSTLQLGAAATWLGMSFVPSESKTVSKVSLYCTAVGGTLGASDLECHIFSDSGAGVPNSSLSSTATVTATPTGAAWVEWTGLSQAVTMGTQYWAVFKNVTASPGTNRPTYGFGAATTIPAAPNGGNTTFGWGKKHSTDSGGAWASGFAAVFGLRIEYSDGSFDGMPASAGAVGAVGTRVYSTRESGVKFVTPSNGRLNVRALTLAVSKSGTPTGNLRLRLYNNTTLVATTSEVAPGLITTTLSYYTLYFSATQLIEPGTTLRVVLAESTQSDASGNGYNTTEYTIENSASSRALLPFTAQRTYYDGSSWSDTDTVLVPWGLVLETDTEFAASAGGAIPMVCE